MYLSSITQTSTKSLLYAPVHGPCTLSLKFPATFLRLAIIKTLFLPGFCFSLSLAIPTAAYLTGVKYIPAPKFPLLLGLSLLCIIALAAYSVVPWYISYPLGQSLALWSEFLS